MIALTLYVDEFETQDLFVEHIRSLKGVTWRPFLPVYVYGEDEPLGYEMMIFALDDEVATMLTLKYGDKIKIRSA